MDSQTRAFRDVHGRGTSRAGRASVSTRRCAANDDLHKPGDSAGRLFVVLEGVVCQHKILADGRRQILAYLFAGDMADPREPLQPHMDHALCVIWPSEVATLTSSSMQRLDQFPNITQAMSRYASTQQAIGREWLVNVGHRTASERLGHLICELYIRLEAVGSRATRPSSCRSPRPSSATRWRCRPCT